MVIAKLHANEKASLLSRGRHFSCVLRKVKKRMRIIKVIEIKKKKKPNISTLFANSEIQNCKMAENRGRPITVFINPNLQEKDLRLFLIAKQASEASFERALKTFNKYRIPLPYRRVQHVKPLLYYTKPTESKEQPAFKPIKRVWFPENPRARVVRFARGDVIAEGGCSDDVAEDETTPKNKNKIGKFCRSLLKPFRAFFSRP